MRCDWLRKAMYAFSTENVFEQLPTVHILHSCLDEESRRQFIESTVEVRLLKGSVVVREGDRGCNMFILYEGACSVTCQSSGENAPPKLVRILSAGACFGELSLLEERPRESTVTITSEKASVLVVSAELMRTSGLLAAMAAKRAAWVDFLRRHVDLFATEQSIGQYELVQLVDALREREVEAGEAVTRKGDPASGCWFFLKEGHLLDSDGDEIHAGEYFGEVELLQRSEVDTTTRVAQSDSKVGLLSHEAFFSLVPLNLLGLGTTDRLRAPKQRRIAASAEVTSAPKTAGRHRVATGEAPTVRSDEMRRRMRHALRANQLFARLRDEQIDGLIDAMVEIRVSRGDAVIIEGERGDSCFLIEHGSLEVLRGGALIHDASDESIVATLDEGASFGELALMYSCPRTASVRCRSVEAILWELDRESFRSILLESNAAKTKIHDDFLQRVDLLAQLSRAQRSRILDALDEVEYSDGDALIQQGSEGEYLYMILQGEVRVVKTEDDGRRHELIRRGAGDYIGEKSLLTGQKTMASVICCSERATIVRLGRAAFSRLLGPLNEILALREYDADGHETEASKARMRKQHEAVATPEWPKWPSASRAFAGPLEMSQLSVTRGVLGEGAFAHVRCCRHEPTSTICAMKHMCKADIFEMEQHEHILQETLLLNAVEHPCIVSKLGALETYAHMRRNTWRFALLVRSGRDASTVHARMCTSKRDE